MKRNKYTIPVARHSLLSVPMNVPQPLCWQWALGDGRVSCAGLLYLADLQSSVEGFGSAQRLCLSATGSIDA